MTLTQGIAEIRDRFQQYETDGIAYAEALAPECGQYSLDACEAEIVIPEEDASIRFDHPIVATARADSLHLCLLVHVEPGWDQPRKKRWKFWQRT